MRKTEHRVARLLVFMVFGTMLNIAQASQAVITDNFDFGIWTPFLTQWKKTVPVCIWNDKRADTTFRIAAVGLGSNTRFRLSNDINKTLPYRVHWHSGPDFQRVERLKAGVASRGVFSSRDSTRCANGPTGLLTVTINEKRLQNAEPGVYDDTLFLTISPL